VAREAEEDLQEGPKERIPLLAKVVRRFRIYSKSRDKRRRRRRRRREGKKKGSE